MNRPSKRFTSSKWSAIFVPAALVFLSISLLIVLAVVGLSVIGIPVF